MKFLQLKRVKGPYTCIPKCKHVKSQQDNVWRPIFRIEHFAVSEKINLCFHLTGRLVKFQKHSKFLFA